MNLREKIINNISAQRGAKLISGQFFPNNKKPSDPALKIILAPIQINSNKLKLPFKNNNLTRDFQQKLTARFNLFLEKYRLSEGRAREISFLGWGWQDSSYRGEDSIAALFKSLPGEPAIILASEINGDFLNLSLAYWDLKAKKYNYSKILDNYRYSELENKKDWQEDLQVLLDFLINNYCLIVSWLADYHYLNNYGKSPLLPKLLPELIREITDKKERDRLLETVIAGYDRVYQVLAETRPQLIPILYLQLAKSASELAKNTLAKQLAESSLKIWLKLNRIANLKDGDLLEIMSNYLSREDEQYLKQLKEIYSLLNELEKVKLTEQYLKQIKYSQQLSLAIAGIFKRPIFQYKIG